VESPLDLLSDIRIEGVREAVAATHKREANRTGRRVRLDSAVLAGV
jgi:hypothetical protein